MRRFYPGTRSLTASILLFTLPVFTAAAGNTQEKIVAESVTAAYMEKNLQSHKTAYLRQMLDSPEKRVEYVKRLYADQMLEQAIIDNGLDKNQPLLETLRNARSRALLDALLNVEFKQINEDLEALAKERFMADPDLYRVRKKIKIALIFVQKHDCIEDQAKAEIEEIAAQLKEQPESDNFFYQLATEHSDDKFADQGGVNKKWLIAPVDLEKSSPILQAAYALETPGQMTDIIESGPGFTIIRLLKVTPAYPLTFEYSKAAIIKQIMSELQYHKRAEVKQSLQADDDLLFDDEMVKQMVSATFTSRTAKAPGD